MLALDPLERSPILSRESLAVIPLRPDAVGDGWFFWSDDLEGTRSKARLLLEDCPSSTDELSISIELSGFWGFSSKSRDMSPLELDGKMDAGRCASAWEEVGQHSGKMVVSAAKMSVAARQDRKSVAGIQLLTPGIAIDNDSCCKHGEVRFVQYVASQSWACAE